ncbi:cupin domain-containing protein [Amycolatopsis rhabdoformis]|uniref:Cupin domain-containing protein n=1 Tax=Amycolatopsis rhabdoformis TaxID=1448059 RepID=A0ABZ1IA57_9PSEU|nr:cupin domain-containing protein [Amycolatopsis rhabdoformis]WSE31351.1 cupin domain-containing protein [Amycolatopsis rhabdoformis]
MGSAVVPVVVRGGEAEVLGAGANRTWLLADASDTDGVMNVVRTTLGPGVDGPPPHFHRLAPEMFYLLGGRLRVLVGSEVVVLSAGDYLLVPPGVVHAWGTPAESGADILIVKAPGENRFDYFRLGDRIRRGEASPAEILATQEEFDNHFTASPVWTEFLAGEGARVGVVEFPGGAGH